MPTYQYACTECGHRFDAVQSFTEDALTDCPQCTGRLRKVFNAVGIVFKGSGFYRTDSRKAAAGSSSSPNETKSETTSGSSDSAGSNGSDSSASSASSASKDSSTGKSGSAGKPKPSSTSSAGTSSATSGSAA